MSQLASCAPVHWTPTGELVTVPREPGPWTVTRTSAIADADAGIARATAATARKCIARRMDPNVSAGPCRPQPLEELGERVRLLEMDRVARAGDDDGLRGGDRGRHPLRDRAELLVVLADHERDRH